LLAHFVVFVAVCNSYELQGFSLVVQFSKNKFSYFLHLRISQRRLL